MKDGIVATPRSQFFINRSNTSSSVIFNLLRFITLANCFQVALGFDITNPLNFLLDNVTYTLKTIPDILPVESTDWETFTEVVSVITSAITDPMSVVAGNVSTTNVVWKLPFCKFKLELVSNTETSAVNDLLVNVVNIIKNTPQYIEALDHCAKDFSMAENIVFAIAIGLAILLTIAGIFCLLKCVMDKYKNNSTEDIKLLHQSPDLFAIN